MAPLLSVIVPFYNVERYLRDCLASIQTQTLTDFECLVIDDGSPDRAYEIAQEFAAGDPRFRLIRSENQGLGPARNLGAGEAQGRYLTFVDSDDIVPPRAYSLMTAVLEESGSAFAAGNARRFDGPDGVTQSWTHAGVFSRTRIGTHINAEPQLIRDRMAWNKVYRSDFWRTQGLEFPAIRYEDYPVSMQAHLAAPAVDLVSTHMYYWRQRGSGDSITQALFEIDNLADRLRSAEWTLDIVEAQGTPAVVRLAHEYFIDIDLVVFARALISAPDQDLAEITRMGMQLAHRLIRQRRSSDPLGDVVHQAFLRGDLDMVRAMARWRDGEGVSGFRSELPFIPKPAQMRPLLRRATPLKAVSDPRKPRRLRSALHSMSTSNGTTTLVVDVRLRAQLAHRAAVDAYLQSPSGKASLRPLVTPTPTGLRLTLTISASDVAATEDVSREVQLWLQLKLPGLTWLGEVDANPALTSGPMVHNHSVYQWAAPLGHGLKLRRLDRVHVVRVRSDEDDFILDHPLLTDPSIVVRLPFPTPDLSLATSGYESRVSIETLLADPPDEPVTGVAERSVIVEVLDQSIQLLLDGDSVVARRGGRYVELARDGWGYLVVRHGPSDVDPADLAASAAAVLEHDDQGGQLPPELGGTASEAAADEVSSPEN